MTTKCLAASLWLLVAVIASAALPRDWPVLNDFVAVTPQRPLAVVVCNAPSFTPLEPAGEPIRLGLGEVFGSLTGTVPVSEWVAVWLAFVSDSTALPMVGLPVFVRGGLCDSTGAVAPAFGPLREFLGVEEVRLAYAQLLGVTALAADPLVVPVDLWSAGPLGELRNQANAAAARGDKAAYQELAGRYWVLFNAAVERRRVLGTDGGARKGQQ